MLILTLRDNPLLGESGYNIGGQPALNNDIFRFVHDAMGHGRGRGRI
jgi:hypothetical protein